ncbi:MAG: HAD-IIIC family phosphatase [Sporomusaceae bacterium]|nr:HAD-IIIC family phosphatase [Sporomusaceae bacterium]
MANPYSFQYQTVLKHYRSWKKQLDQKNYSLSLKIAILGGSTTAQLADLMAVFLMSQGIKPVFYESDYNQYEEDILFDNPKLKDFAPDLLYFHTSVRNIRYWPAMTDTKASAEEKLALQFQHHKRIWEKTAAAYGCTVIQNNWELPPYRLLGNLDQSDWRGHTRFVRELNQRLADYAQQTAHFFVQDLHTLASTIGLKHWHDEKLWYAYKYAMGMEGLVEIAANLSIMILALYGKSKKCLVLDLDNTLWGGTIGDDGLDHIELGPETPSGEAHSALQRYVKELGQRGVVLAVCSKNEPHIAKEGFTHPSSVLSLSDFANFTANWQAKSDNLQAMATTLQLGLDSFVFFDDNPAERQIVAQQLPLVSVPDIGSDVAYYVSQLSRSGYFEPALLSADDLQRARFYQEKAKREEQSAAFASYEEFLLSLKMKAEIKPFAPLHWERLTQLINKTNQFNLTTRRYTFAEVEALSQRSDYVTLYGRLADQFGDNGLVTALIGRQEANTLLLELWIMSCRVLKRSLEQALFDELVALCQKRQIETICGVYRPTAKNAMVASLYASLGFIPAGEGLDGETLWQFTIPDVYEKQNQWIEVNHETRNP